MKVTNKEDERIKSKCSEKELGEALSAMDLASIPPEHRHMAIRARLAEVMMATTTDPKERGKDVFRQAVDVYTQLQRRRHKSRIII
tara:strand:- start:189 stop:446 length:258 start_codon:yes stop_codon:yes gene_type:complete